MKKPLKINCECVGGEKNHGYMQIDGFRKECAIEIKIGKKEGRQIWLEEKSIQKVIKYLEEIIK